MSASFLQPLAAQPLRVSAYERRRPEASLLYQVVQRHWRTFEELVDAEHEGRGLPSFVRQEFEAYLRCGILAHGFVRVRCVDCAESRLVGLSCKRRGFCPSCMGRRMNETAAHLVDSVVPHVPVRQWVLTVPHGLRYALAHDPGLASRVLKILVAAVSAEMRRQARRGGISGTLKTGAVTVIQRFDSALALNVHFHTLVLDGVYRRREMRDKPVFHPIPAPTRAGLAAVATRVFRRVVALLEARVTESEDEEAQSDPGMAALTAASLSKTVASGLRRGEGISPSEMARRMRTSREAVYRLLDPTRTGVTVDSLQRAASALGLTLNISFVPPARRPKAQPHGLVGRGKKRAA